jgi:hypothetical protein
MKQHHILCQRRQQHSCLYFLFYFFYKSKLSLGTKIWAAFWIHSRTHLLANSSGDFKDKSNELEQPHHLLKQPHRHVTQSHDLSKLDFSLHT